MTFAKRRFSRRVGLGGAEVLPTWLESELVFGCDRIFGPHCNQLVGLRQWQVAWSRWREPLLAKSLKYRPGLRPVAMYVVGELPAREFERVPLELERFEGVTVRGDGGESTHWLNVPLPWMVPEVEHLRRLGSVKPAEYRRFKAWASTPNPDCESCFVDRYPLGGVTGLHS